MHQTMTPKEFGRLVGISNCRAYALTRLERDDLRPPGFRCGTEYRIWVDDIDEYLHGGAFAKAMEVVA